jgi:hypothetical protein
MCLGRCGCAVSPPAGLRWKREILALLRMFVGQSFVFAPPCDCLLDKCCIGAYVKRGKQMGSGNYDRAGVLLFCSNGMSPVVLLAMVGASKEL